MKFYQDMDWKKGAGGPDDGVLVSAYLGPEVASWIPAVRVSRWVFLGFLGMKVAEGLWRWM